MDSSDDTKTEAWAQDEKTLLLRYHDDKIDRHRLIHLVKTQPCIWDKENDNYTDKSKKDKAWAMICAGLVPSFTKLSKERKYQIKMQVTKKWNNVRDSYRKYLKGRQNKPYLYAKSLSFLNPVFHVKTEVNDDSDIEEVSDKYEVTWLEDNIEAEEDQHNFLQERSHKDVRVSEMDETNQNDHVISVLSNLIQKEEDEDSMFLKSLLPSLRSLDEDAKIEFRIQVMKLIQHLKSKNRQKLKRKVSDADWMENDLGDSD